MNKIKQKIFAVVMIMTFMLSSVLPAMAVTAQTTKAAPRKSSVALKGDSHIKNGTKRLSISLRDSDVKQTLRMFADKAGLNIIFHNSVGGGTVTLDLVGVTLEDALRMVMQATDLTYFVDGQTLIIMSAEKSKELNITKQNMMILPVKYAEAVEMANFLNKNVFSGNKPGLSNTEVVSVNPAKNELIIFGTQSDYNMAKKVVEVLDEPTRITTFKVNHVTPKEMAKNICNVMLKNYSSDDEDTDSDSDDDSDDDDDDDSDSNSSSSGGGGGTAASANQAGDTNKVKLGEMKIACASYLTDEANGSSNKDKSNAELYTINKNPMKIAYIETMGTVTVVGGSPQQIENIATFISSTDIKQPMAYLEVSIMELNENGSKEFHNDWRFLSDGVSFIWNGSDGLVTDLLKIVGDKNPTGQVTINYYFDYLIKNGKAKTLANPKLMITSGEQSVIDLSEDYVKKVTIESTTGTSTHIEKTYEIGNDSGIVVKLTPYISRDGYITMNISPNYAVKAGELTEPMTGELLATMLARRNLELKNMRVKDGETLILGGLIKETESNSVSKFPVLGDIPVLGFFFKDVENKKTKTELVIVITPHIMQDSADLVNKENNNL